MYNRAKIKLNFLTYVQDEKRRAFLLTRKVFSVKKPKKKKKKKRIRIKYTQRRVENPRFTRRKPGAFD